MGNPLERQVSRRRFLREGREWVTKAATIAFIPTLLSSCANASIEQKATPAKTEIKEDLPQEGDVIFIKDEPHLLRGGKRYPIPTPLDRYVELSKMEKYGRRFYTKETGLEKLPIGEIPKGDVIIDPFTGQKKVNKRFGGEIIVYIGGLLTDSKKIEELDPANDMFTDIRIELNKSKFRTFDNLAFTFGAMDPGRYQALDTLLLSSEEITKKLDEFLKKAEKDFPLCGLNIITHSYGGPIFIDLVREHREYVEMVNNLVFISSPLGGINEYSVSGQLISWFKTFAQSRLPILSEEKASGYLFKLYKNEKRKKEIRDFAKEFTKKGRGITCVVSDADPIISEDTATIEAEGVKNIVLPGEKMNLLKLLFYPDSIDIVDLTNKLWNAHGSPLWDTMVLEEIRNQIGLNLAVA